MEIQPFQNLSEEEQKKVESLCSDMVEDSVIFIRQRGYVVNPLIQIRIDVGREQSFSLHLDFMVKPLVSDRDDWKLISVFILNENKGVKDEKGKGKEKGSCFTSTCR